jgi:hypothetical protein
MMLRKIVMGATCVVFFAFFASNLFAVTSNNIFQSSFTPSTLFTGAARIECPKSIEPLEILFEARSGKRIAVDAKIEKNNIYFSSSSISQDISKIILIFQTNAAKPLIDQATVSMGQTRSPGYWKTPELLVSGALTAVNDSLAFASVGAIDTHTVAFTTSTIPISDSGIIYVVFPLGFIITGISNAQYRDNDPTNDSQEPVITSISVEGNTVKFQLDSQGQEAVAGSRIWVKFWPVIDNTIAGNYNVIVITTKSDGEIENGPASSSAFAIAPGPLNRVIIQPDTAIVIRSDSVINFNSTGYDAYGNILNELNFAYHVTVDSCGQISFGAFRALKLGRCRVIVISGGFADTSGQITVIPGALAHFSISGYPSDIMAGQHFPSNVTVIALDSQNNKKYDYLGQLWFLPGDITDQVPCDNNTPCNFLAADSGRLVIDTTGFILRRSGIRNITATNGTIGVTSGPIRVNPAAINSFIFTVLSPQTAGVAFNASVSNARDIFGNQASGEIVVTDSVGGNSPDGIAPSLAHIIVSGGGGGAAQTLTLAVPSMLKGTVLGGTPFAVTSLFQVNPGTLGRFTMNGFPSSTIAGDTLPPPITVRAFDIFGNRKTDYIGQVTFTSTDTQALLPLPTHFVIPDSGIHNFNQPFSLRSAGGRTITVSDGSISASSPIISVGPDVVISFSLPAPGIVTSGVPFTVSAQNCLDAWGNPGIGIIVISDSVGGGNAPNGSPPSYNNIVVTNGSGSALQTVVNAIPTRLKGVLSGGTARSVTGTFTVLPASRDHYTLSGYPSSVVAGDSFSIPVTGRVFDTFDNLKTNYTGDVYFTSSDSTARLPYTSVSKYHFQLSDAGAHNFGRSFFLRQIGAQTIAITDGTVADTSQSIMVNSAPIVSFEFVPIPTDTVTAGAPFTLSVQNCVDSLGNLARSGTIVISDSSGGGNSPDGYTPTHNNIIVVNGTGNALQTATNAVATRLKGVVQGGTARAGTELLQVVPGTLGRYELSGYPGSTIAGNTFPNAVRVRVFDNLGNLKTNYIGNVYFTSTDPSSDLPFRQGNPFAFNLSHQGDHSFVGSGFRLRLAGGQTISITNGSITSTSAIISVSPNTINSFLLSAIADTATAGVPIFVSADSCLDAFGNLGNGTIVISDSVGGGSSPDGTAPTHNNIVVTGGIGSANQTLTNAIPTRLKGVVQGGLARTATQLLQVIPGSLDHFGLLGYPDSTIAGNPFSDSVRVSAFDNLGNLKTNFVGIVNFTSTDGNANLPNPYLFSISDHGYQAFAGSEFVLKTAGERTISVTNGVVTTTSDNIRVSPNIIASFTLSAPGIVTSGIPFNTTALNCRDSWNNLALGTIIISDSIGGNNAPDGTPPILNNIVVTNGGGAASLTMMKAEQVMLRGVVQNGSARAFTGLMNVTPGALNQFSMLGLPSATIAGDTFPVAPQMVTVKAFDVHGNIKTDYLGTVHFTSTDGNSLLPNPYPFVSQDSGSHDFDGFSLRTVPIQTISVIDGSVGLISQGIIVNPNIITNFTLSAPDTVRSGISFNIRASNCHDIWNNPADGIIIISDSIGGDPAPDGVLPVLNNIIVSHDSGSASQTMMKAEQVILKGIVSGGSARAHTNVFVVMPGALDHFRMAGFPNSIVAGDSFPTPPQVISVSVFDPHGNPKTDYGGNIYFISSDESALLPFTSASPFQCQPQINGSYDFAGPFSLIHVRSGGQTISITDGSIIESSQPIDVVPDIINDFRMSAPLTALSGEPFHISVLNCIDMWGNPANGTIAISDSIGGGMAPNGTRPIYNSIPVLNGTGSALQTLFNADTTLPKGTAGAIVRVTDNSIDVWPGNIANLTFKLSSPQNVGIPFGDTALVTAYDQYANIKDNYDAFLDSVVISCLDGGNMTNNILNRQTDFNQGIADLTILGTTYLGSGGAKTFRATSRSGVVGNSNTIVMNALQCENLTINEAQISQGDTATGDIVINNFGGNPVVVTSLAILDSVGWVSQPLSTPGLPDTLAAGVRRSYTIRILTNGLSIGLHHLTAAVQGSYADQEVADTLNGFPESLDVLSAANPQFIAGSLRPDTLSTENSYSLSMMLQNLGHSGLAFIDTSYFQFADSTHRFRANLNAAVYLPPDSSDILVALDSMVVDSNFTPGIYQGVLHYFASENGFFLFDSLNISDSILIQRRAALTYIPGSLNIDTIVPGQNVAFSIRLANSGNADFIINHQGTRFSFSDSQREYVAYSDTATGRRVDVIHQDTVTFHFTQTLLSSEFQTGQYSPTVLISGTQNGHIELVQFNPLGNHVAVISPASIGIDSTYSMSLNEPFVNISQPCSLGIVVENVGDEGVDSFYVHLSSDGHSHFPDSLIVAHLNGHEIQTLLFSTTASAAQESLEIFLSRITGGIGQIGRNSATIRQARDNTTILIVETDAQLAISPIRVIGPPEAMDDTISVGQSVTISATIANQGQAGILGNRRVLLDLGNSGFSVDSIYRDYILGSPISWTIIAPATPPDSAVISVRFSNIPFDANDSTPAASFEIYQTISFVVDTHPTISQHTIISSPAGATDGILSTGQAFIITDTLNLGGLYRDLGARLFLPSGYSTDDPIIRSPDGNIVSWHIHVLDAPSTDTIGVASWLFDLNTGDSISAFTERILVTLVAAANLEVTARIAGPPTALDGIVEPGGQFQLEATVINHGTANVNQGQVTLRTRRFDMYPIGADSIQDFSTNTPIVWTISLPDSEIARPVPISVVMTQIPVDENTGSPAMVTIDSTAITLLIKNLLPRLVVDNVIWHSGSAVKGVDLDYLAFDVHNNDYGGNLIIGLSGFSFSLNSNPRLSASELLGAASLVLDSGTVIADNLSGNAIGFPATDTIMLIPNETRHFRLVLAVRLDTPVKDFNLSFGDNWVVANALENGYPVHSLTPVTPGGDAIRNAGNPTAILEQNFAGSVTSYPNPFNPRVGENKIGYYLASASNLEIKIFTLLGELVWTKNISASEAYGTAGLHTGDTALGWSGKNDVGNEIRSGVYICIIKNIDSGEEQRFKIAVVK